MTAPAKARRRCARCGWVGRVYHTQKHCHQPRFGKGSYACWGELEAVAAPPRAKPGTEETLLRLGVDETIARAAGEMSEENQRTVLRAARAYQAARKAAIAKREAIKRLSRLLGRATKDHDKLEQRVAYYARRLALTEAELNSTREAGRKRPDATSRGLKLGGFDG